MRGAEGGGERVPKIKLPIKKPRGDARLIIPPIGFLFCVFAFLVFYLIATEIRSARVILEDRATQTASGLLESYHASAEDNFGPSDSHILAFGLYKQNGELIARFGAAPPWSRPAPDGDRQFIYDSGKRTLTLLRPLGAKGSHRAERASSPGAAHRWPVGSLYMTLDSGEYYAKLYALRAISILAPIVTLMIGALFIFLVLNNLKYRDSAEKRERLAFLGESARTLVHEIRNPLGSIRLLVGVLRRRFPAGEVPEIEAIEEETRRLDLLVRRISEFLKNPAGSPARVDLANFLRDFASKHAESLVLENAEEGATVLFDPELLRSVLENLVRNASESYPDEAEARDVAMSLSLHGEAAVVVIDDRGKGIADALKGKIYDPFFTDKPQGSGIGLPLARRFVEAAGGSLELQSRKGGGTEASIVLPLAEER